MSCLSCNFLLRSYSFLIVVFRFAAIVGSPGRLKFALECDFIHFGYQFAFGYYGIIVYINLVDDAGYLSTDFDFRHRFDCSCSCD